MVFFPFFTTQNYVHLQVYNFRYPLATNIAMKNNDV
jgi:hypothetical protein